VRVMERIKSGLKKRGKQKAEKTPSPSPKVKQGGRRRFSIGSLLLAAGSCKTAPTQKQVWREKEKLSMPD